MKSLKRCIAAFLIILFAPFNAMATNIDVLLVFSNDSGLTTLEKVAVAAQYQANLSIVYGDPISGTSGQLDIPSSITIWPLLTEVSYSAGTKSDGDALNWMIDENADITSVLRQAREAFGNPGADLVVMVTPGTTDEDSCGAAKTVPLVTSTANSETHAFAIVALASSKPECPEEFVTPHEVGHLLYAEHQSDDNGDELLPSFRNHAIKNAGDTLRSLMWSHINENKQTEFLSGWVAGLTSGFADNVDFMSDDSFAKVSGYRAPPPPPPFCIQTVFSCNQNNQANVFVSFDEPSGYTATGFSVEKKRDGGSWSVVGGLGLPGCVPTAVNIGFWNFRVTMQTQFGSSQCLIFYLNDGSDCNDGDQW